MKVYVKAVVSLENLRKQYAPDIKDSVFEELVNIDPTADYSQNKGGKYCPWIFRRYKNGELEGVPYQNLRDDLSHFSKYGKKYKYTDIGQYKSVEEFMKDAAEVLNRPLTQKELEKLAKRQAHHASDADKRFCVEDDEWEVWQPLTYAGSIALSREGGVKAQWCTAAESGNDYHWNYYTSKGPLYIFINKNNRAEKYQTHFETESYMYDNNDRPAGGYGKQSSEEYFDQFMSDHPILADFFKIVVSDGVVTRAGVITKYLNDAEIIVIPDGVETLPDLNFPSKVKVIRLPDSITVLPDGAFHYLDKLERIVLPSNITELPPRLFSGCSSLKSVTIPNSVITYGVYAFCDCYSLEEIIHSQSLKHISSKCFYNCRSLTDLNLPDSVESLGSSCVQGSGVTDVVLPDSVTTLKGTFQGDMSLTTVDLNNVTNVLASTFMGSSINEIDLSKVVNIGSNAFRSCSELKNIKLPPEVNVGSGAFSDNESLTTANVPEGATLGFSVFDNCPELTVTWEAEDQPYEFDEIKLLVCDNSCRELIEANKGIVPIRTLQGDVYDIQ